jgi:glutathione S-transferase
MLHPHSLTAIATLLSLVLYITFGLQVGRARSKSGIHAPAMTGDPVLERALRVQTNTLEWLPIYLVSLWLFAIYWGDIGAFVLALVWIVGRLLYSRGYMADPGKRETGFMIQAVVCLILLLGALGKAIYVFATVGA